MLRQGSKVPYSIPTRHRILDSRDERDFEDQKTEPNEMVASTAFSKIIGSLPRFRNTAQPLRDVLVANLVMLGEIPSPTFGEQKRVEFFCRRLSECGLLNCSTDEAGNAFGILPGRTGNTNILVVAHADTVFPERINHTITVEADEVKGPGVADNSLGLAVVATLPHLLERLQISLDANLLLMGASRSLGRGDLEGIRFFLDNNTMPLQAGICVEGVRLGRLSFGSIGMLRGEIACGVSEDPGKALFGTTNAIVPLSSVINKMSEIPIAEKPRTQIIMGSIRGGASYRKIATNSTLRFEVRSESADIVERIRQSIEEIIAEVSYRTQADIKLNTIARRKPGGLPVSHPLPRLSSEVLKELKVDPEMRPSMSELSAFISRGIPAITVGISNGRHLHKKNEAIELAPISSGLAQLVGIIQSIDKGCCDGN